MSALHRQYEAQSDSPTSSSENESLSGSDDGDHDHEHESKEPCTSTHNVTRRFQAVPIAEVDAASSSESSSLEDEHELSTAIAKEPRALTRARTSLLSAFRCLFAISDVGQLDHFTLDGSNGRVATRRVAQSGRRTVQADLERPWSGLAKALSAIKAFLDDAKVMASQGVRPCLCAYRPH